jgi:hypothetical protein
MIERVRALVPSALLCALLLAPRAARPVDGDARDDDVSGFTIVVGGAYAVPRGDLDDDGPEVDAVVQSRTPVWLELGYRFTRAFRLHLFLELSPDELADATCPEVDRCSASGMRLGVNVKLHLLPHRVLDPWVGIGAGIETLETRRTGAGGTVEVRWAGFEAPIVLAGVDVQLGPRVGFGPYATASYAQYTSFRERTAGTSRNVRIDPRASHYWVQAGLRLRVDL